jgi:PBP1b-binding outer membrane lipoprotein LpoB
MELSVIIQYQIQKSSKRNKNKLKQNIMKKLSIIAGLVFTTVFFASCESNEVMPQANSSNPATETIDFMEPEFANQKRPIGKSEAEIIIPKASLESTITTVATEI